MRRGLLTALSVVLGMVCMLIFGVHMVIQCIPVQASQPRREAAAKSFPRAVEGTELKVQHLVSYEGPFWEDGSEEKVAGVAALLVENTGGMMVAHGAVVLEWEERTLVFELSALPPGSRVLVLEKDRQSYQNANPTQCYGWTQKEYPENMGHVTVEDIGGMTMAVVNHTNGRIDAVQICYKTRSGSGIFIGGISYTVEVKNLRPGERRLMKPYRYVCGNSAVVSILAYTEK